MSKTQFLSTDFHNSLHHLLHPGSSFIPRGFHTLSSFPLSKWGCDTTGTFPLIRCRAPWGSQAQGLSGLPFLWLQQTAFLYPPWPSLSCKGQIQAVVNEGRAGMRDQGETVKRHLGARPCYPIKGYTQQYLWAVCRYWRASQAALMVKKLPANAET